MSSILTLRQTSYSPAIDEQSEPISVATARSWLRLPTLSPTDDDEDTEILALIKAAREIAETENNSDLILKQWEGSADSFPLDAFYKLREPLAGVDLFKYRTYAGAWTTLEEGTDFIVDTSRKPGIVHLPYGGSWPTSELWPSGAIKIYFTAGLEDQSLIPSHVLLGIKYLVSGWYNRRIPYGEADDVAIALLRTGRVEGV